MVNGSDYLDMPQLFAVLQMAICKQAFPFSKTLLHMEPWDVSNCGQKFSKMMDWVGWANFMASSLPCYKPYGFSSKLRL
jgi:hypothetical protein